MILILRDAFRWILGCFWLLGFSDGLEGIPDAFGMLLWCFGIFWERFWITFGMFSDALGMLWEVIFLIFGLIFGCFRLLGCF